MGGLTNGRMLIAQAAVDSLKIGTAIAIRYALLRPQFGDTPIMKYVTHQTRLLPLLAEAYALHLGMGHFKNIAFTGAAPTPELSKQLHVMSAGLKAAATWCKVEGLQQCRECCGGQGFLAINKIGPMAVDTNVDATFEGDNTVMMQQVAKALVDAGMKAGGAARPSAPRLPSLDTLGAPSAAAAECIVSLLQFRCAYISYVTATALAQLNYCLRLGSLHTCPASSVFPMRWTPSNFVWVDTGRTASPQRSWPRRSRQCAARQARPQPPLQPLPRLMRTGIWLCRRAGRTCSCCASVHFGRCVGSVVSIAVQMSLSFFACCTMRTST